ncbi:glycosyltransferase 87 family protein [Methylococcus geothermalis]|uniref:glycosyltransferase 87 family protein n=1 Tax=Methylococcus geothermalis TaxID=2681310 RepID=UPI00146C496F|nr:glycosyltransferase 87 family protein [Methylococcus geothermalis]
MENSSSERNYGLAAILAGALLLRIVLAASFKGHPIDVGTFSAWAGHAAEGLLSFYSPGYFADYPPGYIYVLWLIGKSRALLQTGFDTPEFLVMLKFPAIAADLATIGVIHHLATEQGHGRAKALTLAALYAFNPAVIADSAVWGQVDSVLTLFVLLGVLWLERRPAASGAAFAAALLVKPQALIFAPVPLLWLGNQLFRRHTAAELSLFMPAAILVFALGVLPFAAENGPAWVVEKYASTLASYPYASLNAANVFALVGGNGADAAQTALFLSFETWGTVFLFVILGWAAWLAWRGLTASDCVYLAAFLPVSVYLWSIKMHERYLFPALAMLLAYHILSRDRRALWLFLGFSAMLFVSMAQVLHLSARETWYIPRFDPLLLAVSGINLLSWSLLAWIGWRAERQ